MERFITPSQLLIGMAMTIGVAFLSEIALLIHFGKVEIAFAIIFASLSPFFYWLTSNHSHLQKTMNCAVHAYTKSVFTQTSAYRLQSIFVGAAFIPTGCGICHHVYAIWHDV